MASIAIVGGDGAGKTTISRRLEKSAPFRLRYLYMGISVRSSNVVLPTSLLIESLKRSLAQRSGVRNVASGLAGQGYKGEFRSALRLLNRLAEECFRQAVSWIIQATGVTVLYDRHFLYDFAETERSGRLSDRIHSWFLARLYPRPSLTVFLDAPPETLLARKPDDASPQFLEARRRAILSLGERAPNFICVDAAQPLEVVYSEVEAHIGRYLRGRRQCPAAPLRAGDAGEPASGTPRRKG